MTLRCADRPWAAACWKSRPSLSACCWRWAPAPRSRRGRPRRPAIDVPPAWSAAARRGTGRRRRRWSQLVAALRRPAAGRLVSAGAAGQHQRAGAAGRAAAGARLRDVAAAALLPTLGSSASAQRGQSPAATAPATASRPAWTPAGSSTSSAPTAARWTPARPRARASAASLGDVQVSIAAEVALAYIALRSAQARLAIADDNLASQQETLQITAAGASRPAWSPRWKPSRRAPRPSRRAPQLPALQTSIEQTGHALAVLTGQPPAALAALLAAAAAGAAGRRPTLALSLPAETLRQRPDVRAAEHQVAAALARVAQADARALPSFQLGGSLGLSALTLGALTNGASVVSALLASVSLPLFDGGAARAQVRAQQAALDQARAGLPRRRAGGAARTWRTRWSRCAATASAWRACSTPPRRPATPRRWRASATAAAWSTSRPCSKPSAPSSPPRTAWPAPAPTSAPTTCACTRRWAAAGAPTTTDATPRPTADAPVRSRPPMTPHRDAARRVARRLRPAGRRSRPRHPAGRARGRAPGTAARCCGPALLLLAAGWPAACGGGRRASAANAAPSYTTQAVARGNLTLTVTANGTVQPTRSINIGSELSGTVLKVNVDVNDRIKKGQVLVVLDTAKLRDQILRSQAALAAAQAKVAQTAATVDGGARHPGPAGGSGAAVGRQGAVQGRARQRPRHAGARAGRRGQRPRRRQRRAGRAVHRPDQPVQGLDRARRPTAWC